MKKKLLLLLGLRNSSEKNPRISKLASKVEKNAKSITDPEIVCKNAYQKFTKETLETSLKKFCQTHRLDVQNYLPNIEAMATTAVKKLSYEDIKRFYGWESSLIVPMLNSDFVRGNGYFFIKRICIKNKSDEVEVHFDYIKNGSHTPITRKNHIDVFRIKK